MRGIISWVEVLHRQFFLKKLIRQKDAASNPNIFTIHPMNITQFPAQNKYGWPLDQETTA
jgi:hypothetical protein